MNSGILMEIRQMREELRALRLANEAAFAADQSTAKVLQSIPLACAASRPTQKQPVAPVEKAQAAIDTVATPPTLGELQAWLLGAQRDALFDMNHSCGEAFGAHCDTFMQLTTAYQVFTRFMAQSRG